MRSFNMMMVLCLALASMTGCAPADDGNCGSTVGCGGDDDPMPGPDADPGDSCSTADGDACPAPQAIRAGTPGTCDDPAYPVVCSDNTSYCWPSGTDCGQMRFPCGTNAGRCESEDQAANCCGGEAFLCPASAPYYCTEDGTCRTSGNQCASTCEFYGADC